MDALDLHDDRVTYHWTLTGTDTGPAGAGNSVRISGYEEWRIGGDGLIAESRDTFDEAEYRRKLNAGRTRPSVVMAAPARAARAAQPHRQGLLAVRPRACSE